MNLSARKLTILLVDDESHIRDIARGYLDPERFYVIEAESSRRALQLAAMIGFDLLIADILMPKISGRDLALRFQKLQPKVKVLLVSGYSKDVLGSQGTVPEGMEFLAKPFTRKELLAKIESVLAPKQAKQIAPT